MYTNRLRKTLSTSSISFSCVYSTVRLLRVGLTSWLCLSSVAALRPLRHYSSSLKLSFASKMSLQRHETHNPEEFYSFLQQAQTTEGVNNIFLLFTGSKNPSTGKSWCPDCVAAHPLIENILPTLPGNNVFITMHVDREPYRSPDYVFRKDDKIALRCVPTLIKWVDGKAELRLNDDQSQQVAALQEFFGSD